MRLAAAARTVGVAGLLTVGSLTGCGDDAPSDREAPAPVPAPTRPAKVTLTIAAFTTAREAYEKRILPQFEKEWRRRRGQEVSFVTSYEESAVQAAAIVAGYEADVAALSLPEDLDRFVQAGLIRHDWTAAPQGGVASRSVVVIAVRKGNPHGIRDWSDLARPGLRILTPDPRTSGGGRWNVAAVYGAGLRGLPGARDSDAAECSLAGILRNVTEFGKNPQESFREFLSGAGDVAITSESEVIRARMFGNECECVIPRSTLLMENPVVLVDANVDRHGVREVAEAFLDFLFSQEAQRAFAFCGLRPVDPEVAAESAQRFPEPQDAWTIDDLGGWERTSEALFGPGGAFERAEASARAR